MRAKILAIGLLILLCLSTPFMPIKREPDADRPTEGLLDIKLTVTVEVTTIPPQPQPVTPPSPFNWNNVISLLELSTPLVAWALRKWRNRKPIPGVVARPSPM